MKGESRRLVLGCGDEKRGKEHLVYLPHTDSAVSVSAAYINSPVSPLLATAVFVCVCVCGG